MLFADRFLPLDRGRRFLDLASGRTVVIRRRPGAPRAQDAWLQRCARLAGLWHPHLAALVDYGIASADGPFEVLPFAVTATLESAAAAMAIRSALWFLGAVGVAAGRPARERIRALEGRIVLVPDDWTGYELDTIGRDADAGWRRQWQALVGDGSWKRPVAGLVLQPPRVMSGLIEMLERAEAGRAGQIAVTAPAGAGLSTLAHMLAREARERGYLTLASSAIADPRVDGMSLGATLRDRFVMMLGDGRQDPSGRDRAAEAWLLRAAAQSARASFLVTLARGASAPLVVPLDPLPTRDLVEATFIHPHIDKARVLRAAERAMGRPGRFLAALGVPTNHGVGPAFRPGVAGSPERADGPGTPDLKVGPAPSPCASPAAAVAETQPVYTVSCSAQGRRWHERASRALMLAKVGRHAPAERGLREAAAALRRHGDEAGAAACSAALGEILLSRGRARDARDLFEASARSDDPYLQRASTIAIGHCLIDEGRLREAEAALRAACSVEDDRLEDDSAKGGAGRDRSALALARCLYWQGRYDEAAEWIVPAVERRGAAALRRMAAIELARQDVAGAGRLALAAVDGASAAGDHGELARAHAAAIRALTELGERQAAARHRRDGLVAARRARAPLAALDVRLAQAVGDGGDAARIARALGRYRREGLAALWRARIDAVRSVAEDDPARRAAARAAVAAFVRVSGAAALLPGAHTAGRDVLRIVTMLLDICQRADGEDLALGRACAALRDRFRASAVAVFGAVGQPGVEERLAAAGSFDRGTACVVRALASGLLIPPCREPAGIHAAAPMRFAGVVVGALACRWTLDATIEARVVTGLIEASAAALAPVVRGALDRLAAPAPPAAADEHRVIAASPAMAELCRIAQRAAAAPFPVLVEGESGVGKELVARAVHRDSARRGRRFVAVNCAALPDDLFEAELFGHARGAFTGAAHERPGLFEEADTGTLLLDEVSELSPRAQAKLLRAIQEGEVRRVGENTPRRVDVRVIAASNRPLEAEVAAGRFRADLLFRLAVIRLTVPPLRDRPADVHALAQHFWRVSAARTNCRATLDPDTLAALARYDWPGNVRELQNVLSALAVHAPRRGRVGISLLPPAIAAAASAPPQTTLDEARRAFERQYVAAALARSGGHHARTAGALGVSRQGLAKLIKRLGLD